MAFKKIGMRNGIIILRAFLSFVKNKKAFKIEPCCTDVITDNEIKLINCIEENKKINFNNHYFVKIWSIPEPNNDFNLATKSLAQAYEKYQLNTNISSLMLTKKLEDKNFINNTLH